METVAESHGQPDVRPFADDFAAEPGLRHAGDGHPNAVDAHVAPDDGSILMEATRPILVADRRRSRCTRVISLRVERAPGRGAYAENREVVARHQPAVGMLLLRR